MQHINKKILIIFLFLILFVFILFSTKSCDQMYLSFVKKVNEASEIKIGNNYFVDYDGNSMLMIKDTSNIILINSQIFSWNFDSIFIIAKQKPYDSIVESIRIKHPETTYYEYQKLYNESKIYNYWIIDKREDLLWDTINRQHTGAVKGPFTYEEYLEKRRELNVPDTLQLKKTEEWLK